MPFGGGDADQVAAVEPGVPRVGRGRRRFVQDHRAVSGAGGVAEVHVLETGAELRERLPYRGDGGVSGRVVAALGEPPADMQQPLRPGRLVVGSWGHV